MVLYATVSGQFGSLVDYSGRQDHTKHSTISAHQANQAMDYDIPSGYKSNGVPVPSNILQRILREYKNLSKRIIVTGNDRYIHIQDGPSFVRWSGSNGLTRQFAPVRQLVWCSGPQG